MLVFQFLTPEERKKNNAKQMAELSRQMAPIPAIPMPATAPLANSNAALLANNNDIRIDVTQQKLTLIGNCIFHAQNVLGSKSGEEKAQAILDNIWARNKELADIIPDSYQNSLNESLSHLIEQVKAGTDPKSLRLSLEKGSKTITLGPDLTSLLPSTVFSRIHGEPEQDLPNGIFLRQVQMDGMDYARSVGCSEQEALAANRYASKNYRGSRYASHTVNPKNSEYQKQVRGHYQDRLEEYISNHPPQGPKQAAEGGSQTPTVGAPLADAKPLEKIQAGVEGKPPSIQIPSEKKDASNIPAMTDARSATPDYMVAEPEEVLDQTKIVVPKIIFAGIQPEFVKTIQQIEQNVKTSQMVVDIRLDLSRSVIKYSEVIPQIVDWMGGVFSPQANIQFSKNSMTSDEGSMIIDSGKTPRYHRGDDYDHLSKTLERKTEAKSDIMVIVSDGGNTELSQNDVAQFARDHPDTRVIFIAVTNTLNNQDAIESLCEQTGGELIRIANADWDQILPTVRMLTGKIVGSVGEKAEQKGKKAVALFDDALKAHDLAAVHNLVMNGYTPIDLATQCVRNGDSGFLSDLMNQMESDIGGKPLSGQKKGGKKSGLKLPTTTHDERRRKKWLATCWHQDLVGAVMGSIEKGDEKTAINILNNERFRRELKDEEVDKLFTAAVESNSAPLINFFFSDGRLIRHVDHQNPTPMWSAIKRHDTVLLERLIDHGFSPDLASSNLRTPLSFAAELGYSDMVDLLLRKYADPAQADQDGKTPYEYAKNKEIASKIEVATAVMHPASKRSVRLEDPKTEEAIHKRLTVESYPLMVGQINYYNTVADPKNDMRKAVEDVLGPLPAISKTPIDIDLVFENQPLEAQVQVIAYGVRTLGGGANQLGITYVETAPVLSPAELIERGRGDCNDFVTLFAMELERVGVKKEDITLVSAVGEVKNPGAGTDPSGKDGHMISIVRLDGRYYLADMTMGVDATWIPIGEKRPTDEQLGQIVAHYCAIAGAPLKDGTIQTRHYFGWRDFME